MSSPRVSFADMESSLSMNIEIQDRWRKLERQHGPFVSGSVVISKPHHRHRKGNIYHVNIRAQLPSGSLVVNREPEVDEAHRDPYVAIRAAFKTMSACLKTFTERKRDLRRVPKVA